MKMPENAQQEHNHDRETRLRFMHITREKSEALREFWPEVEKNLPRILDDFYKQLTAEPVLVKIIGNNQVSRLVSAQTMHWGRLFNGHFDETYIQGVRTIGMCITASVWSRAGISAVMPSCCHTSQIWLSKPIAGRPNGWPR